MDSVAIRVKGLSKKYRIGVRAKKSDTLMGRLTGLIKSPLENFKRLQSMSKFSDDDESVHWALNDLNFKVTQGEVLGIIGHNGAGKSTLLKILSRITPPTSGEIEITGRVSSLLEVGTGFHPELTGRDNIYMNGTIHGMRKSEISLKLDEIIAFSGIDNYIDTPVKFYSSGMKVRLGFSVAAHLEPEILIIDEVLAVGDAEFQKKCLGKMQDVSKQGRTVLFVSHDMGAVNNLTQKCILLKSGKMIAEGLTPNIIDQYLGLLSVNKNEFVSENLTNLEIFTTQNNSKVTTENFLSFGADAIFHINFIGLKDILNSILFMRIESSKDEIIATINSDDLNFRKDILKNSKVSVKFLIKNLNLLPGTYRITFAIQSSFKEVIEVFHNVSSFEVTNENTPDRLKKVSSKTGKIYLFGEWMN